jgi:hypothetical protein
MSSFFRLAGLLIIPTLLLSGCFPGTVLRCEVFEGKCAFVDEKSYVYLRPQNFDEGILSVERGSSKDLTVLLTGSSEAPDDTFDLKFSVSDYQGLTADGFSVTPSFPSLRAGNTKTLWITVSPEVKPGIYQGKVLALKQSIYAVLDVAIAVSD